MMANKCTLIVFVMVAALFQVSDALQCHQCGQYNDGVGSITPCLNYSAHLAHLHLKDCPRTTDKYCIKYVSELSTVRDCVAECTEKEVWETRTYCCNENGCNGSFSTAIPSAALALLVPIIVATLALMRPRR